MCLISLKVYCLEISRYVTTTKLFLLTSMYSHNSSHLHLLLVDPSLIKLHTRRGRALLRLGHLTEAADSFTHACDVSPTLNVQESDLAAVRADGKNGLKSVVGVRSTLTRLGQLEISEDYTGVLGLVEDLNAQCPRSLLVLVSKCSALNNLTEWGETKECIEDFICSAHSSILRLAAHPSAQLPAPPAERLSWTEKPGKNIVIVDTEAVLQAVLAMGPVLSEIYLVSLKNLDLNRNCSSDVMSRILLIFEELTKFLKSSVKASIPCPDSPPPPLDLGTLSSLFSFFSSLFSFFSFLSTYCYYFSFPITFFTCYYFYKFVYLFIHLFIYSNIL